MSLLSSEPEADLLPGKGRGRGKIVAHKWTRLIHVYTSMICLLLVLFFSLTGITLNHPSWGASTSTKTVTGALPATWKQGDTIDWLVVDEHLRATNGITGQVVDHRNESGETSITFNGPGYSANALINPATGTYELKTEAQGLIGVMNDIHKGRHTTSSFKWVIDVVALFLVLISLTGIFLQFFLRKRRRSAYVTAAVGAVLGIVLMYLSIG
jgi:uncharacterized protein